MDLNNKLLRCNFQIFCFILYNPINHKRLKSNIWFYKLIDLSMGKCLNFDSYFRLVCLCRQFALISFGAHLLDLICFSFTFVKWLYNFLIYFPCNTVSYLNKWTTTNEWLSDFFCFEYTLSLFCINIFNLDGCRRWVRFALLFLVDRIFPSSSGQTIITDLPNKKWTRKKYLYCMFILFTCKYIQAILPTNFPKKHYSVACQTT